MTAQAPTSAPSQDVVVDTSAGSVRGIRQAQVSTFHALPYAHPPVGERRFAAPEDLAGWTGVRDATRPGPISPQAPSRLANVMGDFSREMGEDCLTLTVWTPGADAHKRPVVVWLHGGAFATGAGDLAWYDGARLAREGDVVVVNVNYRLGALGFLRADGLTPGNLGVMDQESALRWVARHIGSLGGDAERVTLMGQSAGGMSIAMLLARPTLPKVRGAIMMSAPLGLRPFDPAFAQQVGDAYVRALGLDPQAADMPAKVRQLPLSALMQAQGAAGRFFGEHLMRPGEVTPPFIPVADGDYLPANERFPAWLHEAATRCDVLIGSTLDEASAFYPGEPQSPLTAELFEVPSVAWARDAAAAGRRAYLYRFDWSPLGSPLGAAHCIDLPIAFGTPQAYTTAPMMAGADPAEVAALSDAMRAAWLGFIHHQSPAQGVLADWPACAPGRAPRMHLSREFHCTDLGV